MINKPQALQIQAELEELCKKHGLRMIVQHELAPALAMIRVKEISIKVN